MTTGKTIALTRQTFVGKVMSLLFNTLSRLVIDVLPRTLESPMDSKEIKPVHLKGISSEYSLEGLMLKLKLQYLGHLM